ncbi:MAG: hypothetical protein VX438_06150 [Planctomycetota bacterium]|nr:hypothetical protein [Planctomycetota bacterium]
MTRRFQDYGPQLIAASLAFAACFGLGTRCFSAGKQQAQPGELLPVDRAQGDSFSQVGGSEHRQEKPVAGKDSRDLTPSQNLLKNSIELLRTQSIRSRVRQIGVLFDKKLETRGTYLQANGGKGGTRMLLEIQTENLVLDVKMVNDGVYFFRQVLVKNGSNDLAGVGGNREKEVEPRVERINLRLVRERYAQDKSWPGHWLAFGGLYLFMGQARSAFDFTGPDTGEIKGVQYSVLRGVWKPEKLAQLVPDQKVAILNRKALDWRRIPHQIPLEIEIYFVKTGQLAGFPYRVVFFRPQDDLLEGITKKHVLITEYSDPEIVDTPAQSEFQFNADENEVRDVTDDFIKSISN